ncbi:MAG: hypothetical protein R3C32_00525 [Chloroflexota bacterium]
MYHMPAQYDYSKRGLLQDLSVLIAQDATFEDVWEGPTSSRTPRPGCPATTRRRPTCRPARASASSTT